MICGQTSGAAYLYPRARMLEMLAALYAAGFGFHLLTVLKHGGDPLAWAGAMLAADQVALAWAIMLASVAHAVGIAANGRLGAISPALRTAALAFQAVLFAWLAWAGMMQTASYTYGWITAGLAYGAANAARDLARALSPEKRTA